MNFQVLLSSTLILLALSKTTWSCVYGVKPFPMEQHHLPVAKTMATQYIDFVQEDMAALKEKFQESAVLDELEKLILPRGFYSYHLNVFKKISMDFSLFGMSLYDEAYVMNGIFIYNKKNRIIAGLLKQLESERSQQILKRLEQYYSMKLMSSLDVFEKIPTTYWQDFIIDAGHGDVASVKRYLKDYVAGDEYLYGPVESLKADRFDINGQDEFGYTALLASAENGKLDVVKELLGKCANPFYKSLVGETALDVATFNGHFEIVDLLREVMK
jgi:hypothetical protein